MRGATKLNLGIGIFAGILLWGAGEANATLLGLKQVQVSNGSQVDLLFDGKISGKQVQTEFFKDIIQVSLNDTAVYPAKISSINGGELTKFFAYQYTPKLVRCRFSVKGQAEDYKDRVEVVPNGKILTVRIKTGQSTQNVQNSKNAGERLIDRVAATAAKAVEASAERANEREESAPAKKVETKAAEERASAKIDDPEQRKILDKVMKDDPSEAREAVERKSDRETKQSKQLTGGKPLPSPFRVFGKLAAILVLFGGIAFVFRKVLKGNPLISRLAKNGLGKKKMIEVLSNHHLGPKKSIAVVRVAGRTMVVGITEESINLITQLGSEGGDSSLNMDIGDLEDLGLRVNEPTPRKVASTGGASKILDQEVRRLTETRAAQKEARQNQNLAASNMVGAGYGPTGIAATQTPAVNFSDVLNTEARKPAVSAPVNNSAIKAPNLFTPNVNVDAAANASSVRARIKSRLEGLKQL